MTTKIILDTRAVNNGEEAPLKISLCKHGKTTYMPTGLKIKPEYWDAKSQKIITHPNRMALNSFLQNTKTRFDNILMGLITDDAIGGLTAIQIKDKIVDAMKPKEEDSNNFLPYYKEFAKNRKSANTKRLYMQTYGKLIDFSSSVKTMRFEDITKKWLEQFESYLANERENDINTIAIDMRNIRAVVNDAIDNDITTTYSFRKKYKIKQKKTRKRSLSIDKLRELFGYKVEPFLQKYLDTFKLTFFLIGINTVDLCNNIKIEDGRVVYERAKTGRNYSIKLEPEAAAILEKYKGKNHPFGLAEKASSYLSFMANLDKYLKQIGPVELIENPNKEKRKNAKKYLKRRITAFPGLSIYWARHTWATIAASLDIPKETISAALGHGIGNQTTSIYIDFDSRKIDEANRKVIDYVLYDKNSK